MGIRFGGLVLIWWLMAVGASHAQSAVPSARPPAQQATAAKQTGVAGTSSGSADQGSEIIGSRPLTLGVGAVAGYFLMMNPYGVAVMGAAMGAMLAASIYDTYGPTR
jgi:hypothetical protein